MNSAPHLLGGRYEVGELIGRGGMAEVHLGRDTRLERQVAIKLLRSDLARDATFLTRFRREAQSSAGLNHPNIVAVYDSGEDTRIEAGGAEVHVPYMVMEFVPGRTLREVLTERGSLDPFEAARITEGVLDALAYSHKNGIVHRDIKPANVMISDEGAVKVMDFGIARAIADSNATMTQTQVVIGTAQYLSPEQAHGQTVDARSDLYSTGCMLFELLTGRPPFIGDTPVSIAYQQVGKPPQPPSLLNANVWPDLDAIVLHALNKDREARYQDAAAFRSDLMATRMGRPISEEARQSVAANAAALGVGGAVLTPAAATEVLSPLSTEPTEVYAAGTMPPNRDLAGVGTGAAAGAGAGVVAAGDPLADLRNTQTMDPIGPRERRSGAAYVVLTLAVIAALALAAFGLKTYLDQRQTAEGMVQVPAVKSLTEVNAKAVLRRAGLESVSKYQPSEDVPQGEVMAQDPPAGTEVAAATTTVTLTVSSGKNDVTVPDLKGKTTEQAAAALKDLGLTLGSTTVVDDTDVEKDKIITSDPVAGAAAKPGDKVSVQVSSGLVTVPNVVGKDTAAAVSALADANLNATIQQRVSDKPEGTVVAQDPADGKRKLGSKVILYVAKKAEPTPTPVTSTPTPSDTPTPDPSVSVTPTP